MEVLSFTILVVILCQSTDACPTHCKTGQTCNALDSGCPECKKAYYGRQCQHRMQCYTGQGEEYRGTRNKTKSGITCQRWDSNTPHPHNVNNNEENFCRNLDHSAEPWCYTIDPNKRWEYCDIPKCDTQCPAPNLDVPFTDITNPPDDGFAVGFTANIQVVCGSGYEPQGVLMTTTACQSDKTWSPTTLPSCKKVQCKSPTLPANSKIGKEQDKYQYQDKITIVCNTGYTLDGNDEITCQSDKTWSLTSASCKKIQCQPPTLPANSKIGKEQDKYEYQDTITFLCNVGYTLDGNDVMTCKSDKTWSAASGSCNKIQCQLPTIPHNSKIGNIKNKYEYQDTITIVCDIGYTIQGNNVIICQSDKTWTSTSAICKKIQCHSPTLPDNSTLVNKKDKYEYEDKIAFVCNHGYSLQGNNEMICQSNKLWSSASGSCKSLCPSLCKAGQICVSKDNGCTDCDQAYYGRQCQHRIQCYTGQGEEYRGTRNKTKSGITCQRWALDTPHSHRINDYEENYCRNFDVSPDPEPWCYTIDPNKRWELCDIPKCDTQCPAPNLDVPFTDITNPPDDGFAVGFTANIQVVCGSGYEPQGVLMTTTTCQSDKTWSPTTLPSCKKVQCKSPTLPANSKIGKEQDKYQYQDKITIVCNTGYTLDGNDEISCQSDKTWSLTSASCKKIQCQPPTLPANSKIDKEQDKYEYQDTITFLCNVGYTLDGNDVMTCQSDKTWSAASGSCNKIQCQLPTIPHNSKIGNIKNKYEYQDTITIVCDIGYAIQGNNVITCQSDKTWTSTSAICKKIQCHSPTLPDNSALVNKKDKYEYEDKIEFVCNHGYSLQGKNEMICQYNKLWSSASGSCKSLCPSLCKAGQICVSEDNGCTDCDQAYYGRQCQHRIQCYTDKGVEYRGTRNKTKFGITCQRWDSDTPHAHNYNDRYKEEENYCRNCEGCDYPEPWCYTTHPSVRFGLCDIPRCDSQCSAPSLDALYVDITNPPTDGFTVGFTAVIDVRCSTGYETNGRVSTTCQSDKTWSSTTLPICKKIQCSMSLLPNNSKIINERTTYQFKDVITIDCNAGYTLEGNNTLTCLADKSWSHPSATCKKEITETNGVGAIVGGTVGGVSGIAVVVIVIVCQWRRKRKPVEKQNDPVYLSALEDHRNIKTGDSEHVYTEIGVTNAAVEKEVAHSSADNTYYNSQ